MSDRDPKDDIIEALKVSQLDLRAEIARLRGKLDALVKATQPMDFCRVCQCVHSNFKDASNHKERCSWEQADTFLRILKEGE